MDDLARRARAAGLRVELRVTGVAVELPAGIDLAAYRIVQEALTNALKHSPGARARVTVAYEPNEIVLSVEDDGEGPRDDYELGGAGGGHGLVGMRERRSAERPRVVPCHPAAGIFPAPSFATTLQLGRLVATGALVNLPAVPSSCCVTAVLVKGISECAASTPPMVALKLGGGRSSSSSSAPSTSTRANWHPFAPYGYGGSASSADRSLGQREPGGRPVGMLAGAAIIFFAYIGFDAVSTPRRGGQATRSATCRSASSPRSSSAPSSTSGSSPC